MLPFRRRLSLGFCVLALAGTAAQAADFDGPYPTRRAFGGYGHREALFEPVFPRPRFAIGPVFERPPEPCRVFVRRRVDAYGEEVVRRVRVCDEPGIVDAPPHQPIFLDGSSGDIPDRRWGGPRW